MNVMELEKPLDFRSMRRLTPMRRSSNDEDVVRAAYDEYAGELLGFAINRVRDRQSAEEMVQETFLKAWRNADRFDSSKGELRSWLYSILRNTIIDAQRRQSVRPLLAEEPEVERGSDDETIDEALMAAQMQQAMDHLSAPHRHVLLATFFDGRSIADVAGELGVPEGTVRSRQFYALKALRVVMEEMGWTDD